MENKFYQKGVTSDDKYLYIAPRSEMLPLVMEYSIAAASAIVRPPASTGEIKTEWEVGTDRNADLDW